MDTRQKTKFSWATLKWIFAILFTSTCTIAFLGYLWIPYPFFFKKDCLNFPRNEKPSLLIESFPIRGPLSWKNLHAELQNEFLMNGQVNFERYEMIGMENFTEGQPLILKNISRPIWTADLIMEKISLAKSKTTNPGKNLCSYGWQCNRDFRKVLRLYPVKGKDVLVVGSQKPWAEAIALAHGAKSIVTVDFNPPMVVNFPQMISCHVSDLGKRGELFDVIVSYSSLEHDGLGRYGDPIHPNGDLMRMKKLKLFLREGGLMLLGVPIGQDLLRWNTDRVYGPVRFPVLVKGWKVVHTEGTVDWSFKSNSSHHLLQPLHVLRPL